MESSSSPILLPSILEARLKELHTPADVIPSRRVSLLCCGGVAVSLVDPALVSNASDSGAGLVSSVVGDRAASIMARFNVPQASLSITPPETIGTLLARSTVISVQDAMERLERHLTVRSILHCDLFASLDPAKCTHHFVIMSEAEAMDPAVCGTQLRFPSSVNGGHGGASSGFEHVEPLSRSFVEEACSTFASQRQASPSSVPAFAPTARNLAVVTMRFVSMRTGALPNVSLPPPIPRCPALRPMILLSASMEEAFQGAVEAFRRCALAQFTEPHQPDVCCWPDQLMLPVLAPLSEVERKALHHALMLPNRPCLRPENEWLPPSVWHNPRSAGRWLKKPSSLSAGASGEPTRLGAKWEAHLVCCPHTEIPLPQCPSKVRRTTALVQGRYDYYHYKVDGFADDGWGCAYRSLQTVLSWFQYRGCMPSTTWTMPSVTEIQRILKRVDFAKESQPKFVGSKEWIGSYEVMLVLVDALSGALECSLTRLESGSQLQTDGELHRALVDHFNRSGCPVMIGGSSYAHTILGIDIQGDNDGRDHETEQSSDGDRNAEVQYLILDPHYSSTVTDMKTVKQKGWCGWKKPAKFFEPKSFYNLCIPKVYAADFS